MEREPEKSQQTSSPGPDQAQLSEYQALVAARFEKSMAVSEAFFRSESGRVAEACREMARRFHQGGRLLAFGSGAAASDAQHVAVEFVHPVTVGRRALPGLALPEDTSPPQPVQTGQTATTSPFTHSLSLLARPHDIAIGVSTGPEGDRNLIEALEVAHQKGLVTLVFTGGLSELAQRPGIDFCFVVGDTDPWIVQETHRTLYHILWELVHVYFEHEGLLQV
jgi:D-sedoheptulose 7-phosphate isomerase